MEAKSTINVTEMSYESNPVNMIIPSYKAFLVIAPEYFKLIVITIATYFIAGIPALIAIASLRPITKLTTPSPSAIGLIFLSLALIAVIGFYLSYAFTKISIAAARGAKLAWKEALPKKYSDAWELAWTMLLSGLIIVLGLIALIIPGIILAIRYSQVQYVVVDEGLTGMAALRRSQELVAKRNMDLAGLVSLGQVIGLISKIPVIGNVLLIIYSIATSPILAIRYIQLTQLNEEDRTSTPTNKINYVLLVLAIIVTITLSAAKRAYK